MPILPGEIPTLGGPCAADFDVGESPGIDSFNLSIAWNNRLVDEANNGINTGLNVDGQLTRDTLRAFGPYYSSSIFHIASDRDWKVTFEDALASFVTLGPNSNNWFAVIYEILEDETLVVLGDGVSGLWENARSGTGLFGFPHQHSGQLFNDPQGLDWDQNILWNTDAWGRHEKFYNPPAEDPGFPALSNPFFWAYSTNYPEPFWTYIFKRDPIGTTDPCACDIPPGSEGLRRIQLEIYPALKTSTAHWDASLIPNATTILVDFEPIEP